MISRIASHIVIAVLAFVAGYHASAVVDNGAVMPSDYTVVEDYGAFDFKAEQFSPRSFDMVGEYSTDIEQLRERALGAGCAVGLANGKRMLSEPENISEEFQGVYGLFPGTIMEDRLGKRRAAFLYFEVDAWRIVYLRTDIPIGSIVRVVCPPP